MASDLEGRALQLMADDPELAAAVAVVALRGLKDTMERFGKAMKSAGCGWEQWLITYRELLDKYPELALASPA